MSYRGLSERCRIQCLTRVTVGTRRRVSSHHETIDNSHARTRTFILKLL